MAAIAAASSRPRSLWRHSSWDALFVLLSIAHGGVLAARPPAVVIALGLWWSANSVSHNFVHLPFFRSRWLNRGYALYLSALLGLPQSLWRARHLGHHGGHERAPRWTRAMIVEAGLVLAVWAACLWATPRWFLSGYVPGWIAGLGLCWLQGHFEHAGGTTSHYGWLYNLCFFNDGYHVEHHLRPSTHWTRLRAIGPRAARQSRWPPVLRWLELVAPTLEGLERIVLRSRGLQRFVLDRHERAFRTLLARVPEVRTVTIVGGGLFPRTAMVLERVLPAAEVTVVDASACNIALARRAFTLRNPVRFVCRFFEAGTPEAADLVVVPLAFIGDRRTIYQRPPARAVLVHDWIWSIRGESVVISWLLLKRLSLVRA